jgi:hypothetical protein
MKRAVCLIVAALAWLGAAPAWAASPEQIYEFIVLTDTVQTPPICGTEPGEPKCTFREGKAPYLLATLTLTHDALTQHGAQLSDMTDPPTDDGRVISLVFSTLPGADGDAAPSYLTIPATNPYCPSSYPDRLFQTIPPCSFIARLRIGGEGYTLDLGPIIGNHLSGTIDIVDFQEHCVGCTLQMQGRNNNWSGTWECVSGGGSRGSLHSFTAISTRINGPMAQR